MPLPVKLRKEKNAIKEAAIALFLSSPIIKPSRFQELIKDPELKDFFQKFEGIKELKVEFSKNNKGLLSTGDQVHNTDAGFRAMRFVDGEPEFVLQGQNKESQSSFSFHQLKYHSWTDFIEAYKKTIGAIEKIQTEIFVSGISLHYIDEFVWVDETPIDLSKILTPKDYLPNNFISTKDGQIVNIRELDREDGNKGYDRLEIKINSNISKTITISHNKSLQFTSEGVAELTDDEYKLKIIDYLNEFHAGNKKFLNDVLLQDVKTLIGLK